MIPEADKARDSAAEGKARDSAAEKVADRLSLLRSEAVSFVKALAEENGETVEATLARLERGSDASRGGQPNPLIEACRGVVTREAPKIMPTI